MLVKLQLPRVANSGSMQLWNYDENRYGSVRRHDARCPVLRNREIEPGAGPKVGLTSGVSNAYSGVEVLEVPEMILAAVSGTSCFEAMHREPWTKAGVKRRQLHTT